MKKFRKTTYLRFRAFTLIEILVVIAIIAALVSILVPSLAKARDYAKSVICMNNLRQMGVGLILYADASDGYMMPCADGDIFWWGEKSPNGIDHEKGFLYPHLQSELRRNGVYECPSQTFGKYKLQAKPDTEPYSEKWITSTYGYNGYYLSSPKSRWIETAYRPWNKITTVITPSKVMAFADTMLDRDPNGPPHQLENTALLDPPRRIRPNRRGWDDHDYPTTCFRHDEKTNAVFVDGHCGSLDLEGGSYKSEFGKIGSVGTSNAPYYVPDFKQWLR